MSNTDVVREVDEELRREQYEKLWKENRTYILTAAALVVAVVAGYKGWQGYQARQAATAGAQFDAAAGLLRDGKKDEAMKAYEAIATNGTGAYSGLAGLRLAALAGEAGKTDDALARYEALSSSTALDATLRGFAQIQAAQLRLDKADLAEMQTRLGSLANPVPASSGWLWTCQFVGFNDCDTSGIWRQSARQLLGLSAYKAGKLPEAEAYFSQMLGDKLGRGPSAQVAEMMRELILSATAKPVVPAAATAKTN